ncbi:MAG: N-acetyltransferase family protein [Candidatus Methylacidiphilales bacterium]
MTAHENGLVQYALRLATALDQAVIREMLYQSLYVPEGELAVSREILDDPKLSRYAADWGRPGDVGILAEAGDEVLGAAWCRLFRQDAPGYGFISSEIPEMGLAVAPQRRGRGIGTALLNALIAEVQNPKAGRTICTRPGALSLSVMRGNPVIRLYQRCGFRVISESEVAFVMRLDF